MSLCKNPRCMKRLSVSVWGDGYCCRDCHTKGPDYDPEAHAGMGSPDVRTGLLYELINNADLTDAMTQAYAIDPRLPKIIYLRRKKMPLRKVAESVGLSHVAVNNILDKLTPNLLRACWLRNK